MTPLPKLLWRDLTPEGAIRWGVDLPPTLPAFSGHFPNQPILPGVVQLDWAARLGEVAYGQLGAFAGFWPISSSLRSLPLGKTWSLR